MSTYECCGRAKHVEEEDVAGEVRPAGVAEDGGDPLPPLRVHVVQVKRFHYAQVPQVGPVHQWSGFNETGG